MTRPLATCQCDRWPGDHPCSRTATAEDFLCDPCRKAKHGDELACIKVNGPFSAAHAQAQWTPLEATP